jgi:hypothetical protein
MTIALLIAFLATNSFWLCLLLVGRLRWSHGSSGPTCHTCSLVPAKNQEHHELVQLGSLVTTTN